MPVHPSVEARALISSLKARMDGWMWPLNPEGQSRLPVPALDGPQPISCVPARIRLDLVQADAGNGRRDT